MCSSKQRTPRHPKSVLVTRPSHQSAGFIKQLEKAGFKAVPLPVIEIQFVTTDLTDTLNSGLVIFTSANAVTGAHKNLALPWHISANTPNVEVSALKIAAIGRATAKALTDLNSTVDLVPTVTSSTEALLDIIGDVSGLVITIIRGESGREALYNSLQQAGATPVYQTVYKRVLPQYRNSYLKTLFIKGLPDIISVTSDLGLHNLLSIIPTELQACLLSRPLIVNSQRCAMLAADKGFHAEILVADPPGDSSQLQSIQRLTQQ